MPIIGGTLVPNKDGETILVAPTPPPFLGWIRISQLFAESGALIPCIPPEKVIYDQIALNSLSTLTYVAISLK